MGASVSPSAPWSGGGLFSSVLPPRNGRKVWRAYYDSGFCPPSVPAAKCLQGMGGDGVLYAESADGLSGWTVGQAGRPWGGSSRSNIVYTCPAGNALYENDQTKEVVVFFSKSDHPSTAYIATSRAADGLNFSGPPQPIAIAGVPPHLPRWDAETNCFFDTSQSRWVCTMRAPRDPACGIWWPLCLHSCGQPLGRRRRGS